MQAKRTVLTVKWEWEGRGGINNVGGMMRETDSPQTKEITGSHDLFPLWLK